VTPAGLRSVSAAAGRRCGYAFSYDEHCGRLVADSMKVFASTQSLNRVPSLTAGGGRGLSPLRHSVAVERTALCDVDELVWYSASDVDDKDPPTSRRLEVLTE